MKHLPLRRAIMILCASLPALLPATAGACSACMGDVNSRIAPAINDAIFFMLGCIGLMLACLASFAFYLMKRARSMGSPDAALAETLTSTKGAH